MWLNNEPKRRLAASRDMPVCLHPPRKEMAYEDCHDAGVKGLDRESVEVGGCTHVGGEEFHCFEVTTQNDVVLMSIGVSDGHIGECGVIKEPVSRRLLCCRRRPCRGSEARRVRSP